MTAYATGPTLPHPGPARTAQPCWASLCHLPGHSLTFSTRLRPEPLVVLKLVSLVQPTNLLPEKGISWCCGTRPHTHAHQPARGVPPALRVHVDSWVQEPDPRPMQTGLSPAGTRAGERTLGGKGPGSQGTGAHTTATEAAAPPRSVLSMSFRARGTCQANIRPPVQLSTKRTSPPSPGKSPTRGP